MRAVCTIIAVQYIDPRLLNLSPIPHSDSDGIVKLWDLASCRPRLSFPTPTGPRPTAGAAPLKGVLSLHPLHGGRQLLTHQRGGVITAWDVGDGGGGEARSLGNPIHTGAYHFCKAAFPSSSTTSNSHPQGSVLLLAPLADAGTFGLWDTRVDAGGGGSGSGSSRPVLTFEAPPVDSSSGGTSGLAAMAGGGGRGLCMALRLLLEEDDVDGDGSDGGAGAGTGTGAIRGGYALAAYEDGSLHAFDLRRPGRAACGAKLLQETGMERGCGL